MCPASRAFAQVWLLVLLAKFLGASNEEETAFSILPDPETEDDKVQLVRSNHDQCEVENPSRSQKRTARGYMYIHIFSLLGVAGIVILIYFATIHGVSRWKVTPVDHLNNTANLNKTASLNTTLDHPHPHEVTTGTTDTVPSTREPSLATRINFSLTRDEKERLLNHAMEQVRHIQNQLSGKSKDVPTLMLQIEVVVFVLESLDFHNLSYEDALHSISYLNKGLNDIMSITPTDGYLHRFTVSDKYLTSKFVLCIQRYVHDIKIYRTDAFRNMLETARFIAVKAVFPFDITGHWRKENSVWYVEEKLGDLATNIHNLSLTERDMGVLVRDFIYALRELNDAGVVLLFVEDIPDIGVLYTQDAYANPLLRYKLTGINFGKKDMGFGDFHERGEILNLLRNVSPIIAKETNNAAVHEIDDEYYSGTFYGPIAASPESIDLIHWCIDRGTDGMTLANVVEKHPFFAKLPADSGTK